MDNQAGNQFELGWIIGAIDGEGTITMNKGNKSGTYFKPSIQVANTDEAFIIRMAECLDRLDIPYFIGSQFPSLRGIKYRKVWSLCIQGYKRVQRALTILRPELFATKSKQARLVSELVNRRLATPMTHRNQHREFSERELELLAQLRECNRRGKFKPESPEAMSKV